VGFTSPGYKLKWPEGHELHGLEIRSTGLSIDEMEQVAASRPKLAAAEAAGDEQARKAKEQAIADMITMFAAHLKTWNWEEPEGTPVPADADAIRALDARQIIPVIQTWMSEVTSIPDPLPQDSASGQPFQAESRPMDLPSPNLSNLPVPA
jgi:hypothetical protein